MKLICPGSKMFFAGLLLLLSNAVFADSAVVDCTGATPGAFTTITAALASLPATGPNSISVSGTCTENVVISGRTGLSIFGNPSATVHAANANGHVLAIFSSQNVGVSNNVVFDGGRGISIASSPLVEFDAITVQNSGGIGITSIDSLVHLSNSTIKSSVRTGISVGGGTFYLDSGVTVTNNGRTGVAVLTGHLILNGGDGTPGTENVVSNNANVGLEVASTGEADISGDNRITGNGGKWGMLVLNGSGVLMTDGTISSNTGLGVHCGGTSHCEFGGNTHINSNGAGGIEVVEHSDASLDGSNDISGNTGAGVLVDQSSSLTSLGGNTINNNTDDGVIINTLSVVKFAATDTITGNGKLALECNNGSLVSGDISTYKPKKCGTAFQATPIN
jgi:Right handed beta helix region